MWSVDVSTWQQVDWHLVAKIAISSACMVSGLMIHVFFQQRRDDDAKSLEALRDLQDMLIDGAPCDNHGLTQTQITDQLWQRLSTRGHSPSKPIRILSLDGGGVRGAYSAQLLTRLEERLPGLTDNVDVVAGTSTGVMLGGLLAMGYNASQAQQIFNRGAVAIFRISPWWREYNPFTSVYDGKWKEHCFDTIAGQSRLSVCTSYLLCTAFRTHVPGEDTCTGTNYYQSKSHWHPDVITNLPIGPEQHAVQSHMDLPLRKIGMLATAAPTWFPAYDGFIDGAMFANNPALEALIRVMAIRPDVPLSNIAVLSLGTGLFPNSICFDRHTAHWGIVQWAAYIIDLIFDSTRDATEFNMTMLLRERFHRVQGALTDLVPLGDGRQHRLDNLMSDANDVDLEPTVAFLEQWFMT
eukprot:m.191938 g.191938  ORF g.191938 m.191938 type:complete len:409 (+) comp16961_c1_seq5:1725-2951(+)